MWQIETEPPLPNDVRCVGVVAGVPVYRRPKALVAPVFGVLVLALSIAAGSSSMWQLSAGLLIALPIAHVGHEVAHTAVARWLGTPIHAMVFSAGGGAVRWGEPGSHCPPYVVAAVAAGGPAWNLVTGVVMLVGGLLAADPIGAVLMFGGGLNFTGLLNLVPWTVQRGPSGARARTDGGVLLDALRVARAGPGVRAASHTGAGGLASRLRL